MLKVEAGAPRLGWAGSCSPWILFEASWPAEWRGAYGLGQGVVPRRCCNCCRGASTEQSRRRQLQKVQQEEIQVLGEPQNFLQCITIGGPGTGHDMHFQLSTLRSSETSCLMVILCKDLVTRALFFAPFTVHVIHVNQKLVEESVLSEQ